MTAPATKRERDAIAPWARPLLEELASVQPNTPAALLLVATLAPAVAYARVSNTSRADFLSWGLGAWNRSWNYLPELAVEKSGRVTYPTVRLDLVHEELAEALVSAIADRRAGWERAGSPWADEVGTAQVAALLVMFAGRVVHATHTGFSGWRALLERAWLAGDLFVLDVMETEKDAACP